MTSDDRLSLLRERNEAELAALVPEALGDFPLRTYLAFFDALPAIAPYHAFPAPARDYCAEVEARGGRPALEAYNRLAMLGLIGRGVAPLAKGRLSGEVRALLDLHLTRILDDMDSPRKGFYRHGNDLFAKDFAVCRGKLVPCGVELVDVCSGVGRRMLTQGGVRQFAVGTAFFLGRMGGFWPMYELHFDRRLIGEFNEAGYTALYLRLADLLAINPHVRGVVSNSWWHDPRLAEISPELAFIGHHPESAGARIFRGSETPAATADATRFAPRRTALYKAGEYCPRVHLLAWARRDVLAWAERYRATAERESRPQPVSRAPSSAAR